MCSHFSIILHTLPSSRANYQTLRQTSATRIAYTFCIERIKHFPWFDAQYFSTVVVGTRCFEFTFFLNSFRCYVSSDSLYTNEIDLLFVSPRVAGDSRRNLRIYGSAACAFSFSTKRPVVGNSVPTYDDADGDSINIYGDGSVSFCFLFLPCPSLPLSPMRPSGPHLNEPQDWLSFAGQKGTPVYDQLYV